MSLRRRPAVVVLILFAPAVHGQFYQYQVIAKAGQAGLTDMGDGPSINDGTFTSDPLVAFIGQTQGFNDKWEGVFVGDGGSDPVNISIPLTDDQDNIAPECQINYDGKVVCRSTRPNPEGVAFTYIWRWDANNPGAGVAIADSINQNPFRAVNPEPTMNDSGTCVWSGLDQDVKKVLATGTKGNYTFRQLPSTPVRPMLSDFGQVVLRNGNGTTDPITLLNASLTKVADCATSPNFSMLGRSPGISPDAQVVVFAGDLSQGGADALNAAQANWSYGPDGVLSLPPLRPGPGIFASVNTAIGRVVVRIAGVAGNGILDPGETWDDINGNGVFDPGVEVDLGACAAFPYPDARVAVNGTLDSQRAATVCYLAQNAQGRQGLYSNRLNIFGTMLTPGFDKSKPGFLVVGQTTTVIEEGKTIPGLSGAVQSIGVYDPINARDRGDIAFYAKTANSAGIVRARPVQVVFMDFHPKQNFKLTPANASLFGPSGLGCPATWDGNMDLAFQTFGPDRSDLIGPGAFEIIQNAVVDLVQDSYDRLSAGGESVNVKILGKVGEQPPVGGPFIRMYVGDSPFDLANPSGVSGIAPLDLFNQKCLITWVGGAPQRIDSVQDTPLILMDNTFRESSRLFTNENPANPDSAGLNDFGANKVTREQVINGIGTTAAHELGHNLGLSHLDNARDDLLMNAYTSSCMSDGHAADELRYPQEFGVAGVPLESSEYASGSENSGARLALTLGSNEQIADLDRDQPPPQVLAAMGRSLLRTTPQLDSPITVKRAVLGVVPTGIAHAAPYFVDLGAGDLKTIMDVEVAIGPRDAVILLASTESKGIDIFGVRAGFGGQVKNIKVDNALLVMADERLRARPLDADGKPVFKTLDIYRRTPNGDTLIGSIGDPAGNKGPTAKNDAAQTPAGQPVTIGVLTNDTDPDGLDKASVTITASPDGVAVQNPATGQVKYTPRKGFAGIDTFRYTVRDTKGALSNEATVTVTVTGGPCYADCDGSGALDLFDFLCFVNRFNAQDAYADCDSSGAYDLFDFLCFVNQFNQGC